MTFVVVALVVAPSACSDDSQQTPQAPIVEPQPVSGATVFEDFVGSEACAKCHAKQYDAWANSTHGRAGGVPSDKTVIARFDGKPLHFADGVVTPFRNDKGDYLFRVEQQGERTWDVEADYFVGGGHMVGGGTQAFFSRFPDGTLRFLPFDYIRAEDVWFVQLHNGNWKPISREISLRTDVANWPPRRVLGAHAGLDTCQNCHGSQVTILHDPARGTFDTKFTSLRINCESCHGAGRRHVEIVDKPGYETVEDIGMQPLAAMSKDDSLMVCFQCHATKMILRDGQFPPPGENMEHHISLKLETLDGEAFLVDGRVRKFGYQANHLYSDCYLNGSMTCVDCHDPHSQHYRDVFWKPLQGKFDDGQCTSCHASKATDLQKHTHHAPESEGSRCTSCHMPFLQHQGLGHDLRFARSDHVIPIPRPAFDASIGIENACVKCHADLGTAAMQMKVDEWYGEIKPHAPAVANLIEARGVTDAKVAARLLLDPDARHPMAQMQGLSMFLKRFPPGDGTPDPEVVDRLMRIAGGSDLDLKSVALMALEAFYGREDRVRRFLAAQAEALGADAEAVKTRWGTMADRLGEHFVGKKDPRTAMRFMESAVSVVPDDAAIRAHLAMTYMLVGDAQRAVPHLQAAIRINPADAELHVHHAMCLLKLKRVPAATAALQEALKLAPDHPKAKDLLRRIRTQGTGR